MAEYFKTYINRHCGELDDEVFPILAKHTEWWGETTAKDLLHTSMYDILDEEGNLLGFFGNSLWNNGGEPECVLCTAYVKPEYRGLGLFNKMVKYTIEHNTEAKTIVIGAMDDNELANTIYSRKFPVMFHDGEEKCTWYMIKDIRERISGCHSMADELYEQSVISGVTWLAAAIERWFGEGKAK